MAASRPVGVKDTEVGQSMMLLRDPAPEGRVDELQYPP
jgi:hypothetical protein